MAKLARIVLASLHTRSSDREPSVRFVFHLTVTAKRKRRSDFYVLT